CQKFRLVRCLLGLVAGQGDFQGGCQAVGVGEGESDAENSHGVYDNGQEHGKAQAVATAHRGVDADGDIGSLAHGRSGTCRSRASMASINCSPIRVSWALSISRTQVGLVTFISV